MRAWRYGSSLRSPLTRIAGFSQALQESYADRLDATGRLHLERVNTSARRMCQLVDDLLNFSRVTRLQMRREPVDLSALSRSIVAELESRDPARRLRALASCGAGIPYLDSWPRAFE